MCRARALLLSLAPLLALTACADDGSATTSPECERSEDCDGGQCTDGRCVAGGSGDTDAAGLDGTDGTATEDAPGTLFDATVDPGPDSLDAHGIDAPAEDVPHRSPPDTADTQAPKDVALPPDAAPDVPWVPACDSDDDCPGLQTCDGDLNEPACAEPAICLAQEDCAPGRVCDRGGCEDTWSGCTWDADCAGGLCDLATHTCADHLPCSTDLDCADGRVCIAGACVECGAPADCPSGAMKCVDNLCYEPAVCAEDLDCLEGASCLGGQCAQPHFADDPFEPNDSAPAAKALAPGEWTGLTIQSWDDDWFAVSVPAGFALLARVRYSPSAGDLDLSLLDTTALHVLSMDVAHPSWAVVGVPARPSPQTYLLRVQNPSGTVPEYDLTTALVGKPLCVPDAVGAPAPGGAELVEGSELVTHGASLCPGEADWYMVQTFGSASVTAAIMFPHALGDLDVRIFDGDLELASASAPGAGFEVASVANVSAGTWYVEVRGATDLDHNGYALSIKTASSASCQLDSMEVNDGPIGAPDFEGLHEQLTLCPGDVDWFATTVPAGQGLVSTITYANFSAQLAVDVIDVDGATLLASAPGAPFPKGVKTQAAAYEVAPKAKTVYTRVRRVEPLIGDQFVPYSLQVAVVPGFCVDDDAEPDSGWDLAHPLPTLPGQSVTGKLCPGDPGDWFAVTLDGASVLTVDLEHQVDLSPLDLALIRPDGVTVEPVVASWFNGLGKTLTFDASKSDGSSGTWYVRVSGETAATYRISAAVASKSACPLDDLWEPNDTPLSSKSLPAGSTISPYFCANNPDFFQIQASPGGSLTVSVTPPASSPKVVFQLLDPDLGLAWSETVTAAKQLSLGGQITKSGIWFLAFRSPLPGTYSIKVEGGP